MDSQKQQFAMETLVAMGLWGADNDSYMHRVCPHCCVHCGYATRKELNPLFKLQKKRFDFSCTYDGYYITSQKFREFCLGSGYTNIVFHELKQEPGFYFFEILTICPIDYGRRKVRFLNYCPNCGRYAEVIGATPSYLATNFSMEPHSICRSEYEFGSYSDKVALAIVSLDVAKAMKAERFKGLYFTDVFK